MNIKNKPSRVFLQIDDEIVENELNFNDLHQLSWSDVKINENDIVYYHKDFIHWLLFEWKRNYSSIEDAFNEYSKTTKQ
jgi:hypothetical protein